MESTRTTINDVLDGFKAEQHEEVAFEIALHCLRLFQVVAQNQYIVQPRQICPKRSLHWMHWGLQLWTRQKHDNHRIRCRSFWAWQISSVWRASGFGERRREEVSTTHKIFIYNPSETITML